jgi:hypothetical protein
VATVSDHVAVLILWLAAIIVVIILLAVMIEA